MEFLNEIQHFKIRLEILENERYELEEKVRQLQVSSILPQTNFHLLVSSSQKIRIIKLV